MWQNTTFTANASNAAISGSAANPSGDGITNLLKYAIGLDPTVPGVGGLPVTTVAGGHLKMQFQRNVAATDLTFVVEAGIDLSTSSAIATFSAGATGWTTSGATVTDNNGATTFADATAVASASRRFLRLRVFLP